MLGDGTNGVGDTRTCFENKSSLQPVHRILSRRLANDLAETWHEKLSKMCKTEVVGGKDEKKYASWATSRSVHISFEENMHSMLAREPKAGDWRQTSRASKFDGVRIILPSGDTSAPSSGDISAALYIGSTTLTQRRHTWQTMQRSLIPSILTMTRKSSTGRVEMGDRTVWGLVRSATVGTWSGPERRS